MVVEITEDLVGSPSPFAFQLNGYSPEWRHRSTSGSSAWAFHGAASSNQLNSYAENWPPGVVPEPLFNIEPSGFVSLPN